MTSITFYIILTTFLLFLILWIFVLWVWCTNEEKRFRESMGENPRQLEDLSLAWSDKNGMDESETSITSVKETRTLLLPSEVSNKLSVNPSTHSQRLETTMNLGNQSRYRKPVDIIIHVEDFDEICSRNDIVSLNGSLGLLDKACDEDDNVIEVLEMKEINMWEAWEKSRLFTDLQRKSVKEVLI